MFYCKQAYYWAFLGLIGSLCCPTKVSAQCEQIFCPKKSISCVTFLERGKKLATGNYDGNIEIWRFGKSEPVQTLTGGHPPHTNVLFVRPTRDKNVLLSVGIHLLSDRPPDFSTVKAIYWDITTGAKLKEFIFPYCFDVSADGKYIAVGTEIKKQPSIWPDKKEHYVTTTVTVYELATQKEHMVLKGHESWVTAAKFAPSGTTIATVAGAQKEVMIWDLKNKQRMAKFTSKEKVGVLSFPKDDHFLYTAGGSTGDGRRGNKDVQLWLLTGQPRVIVAFEVRDTGYLEISPDNRILALSARSWLRLLDIRSREQVLRLRLLPDGAECLAFSADGKMLALYGAGTIKVWDMSYFVGR